MRRARHIPIIIALLLAGPARADPLDLKPIEVRDRRMEPGSAKAEDTAFTTAVDASRAATEGGGVAEHLARSVGIQVRRTGSHGDFASVLIRGSSASQVGLFLDGIPLSQGRGGLLDLSLFPALTLARIEVFRGYVPAEFGGEGIGGAINLIPARAGRKPKTRFSLGLGSFGYTQVGLSRSARHGPLRYAFSGGLQHSQGDFTYYSDNGTEYNPADDRTLTRTNNHAVIGSVLGWTEWRISRHLRLTLLESFSVKDKGLPGLDVVPTERARFRSLHQVVDLKLVNGRFGHPSLTGMLRLHAQVTRDRFLDPDGELGIGTQDQTDLSWSLGAIGRLSWAPHDPQILSLIPEWRYESYQGDDPARQEGLTQLPRSRRYRFGLALRDRIVLWDDRISLTPVVRLDLLYSDATGTTSGGRLLHNSFHFFLSPRLGVRTRIVKGISIKGNVGRYFRPPSLLELYGNRGTAVGNEELHPEKGVSGDIGVVVKRTGLTRWLERLLFEAAFFGRLANDLIQWVQTSQRTAKAFNISEARALGGELSLGAWLRLARGLRARFTANYTLLWTENLSGKPLVDGNRLPGRPLHELNGRVDLVWRWKKLGLGLHYAVMHVSDSFLDEANLFQPVPTRTLHEVGLVVSPWIRGVSLTATFKNIANTRVEYPAAHGFSGLDRIPRALADFAGYPLPGWSFMLTLLVTG